MTQVTHSDQFSTQTKSSNLSVTAEPWCGLGQKDNVTRGNTKSTACLSGSERLQAEGKERQTKGNKPWT